MKPKLALVKYGDKVVLAALVLFVLWAASQVFVAPKEASSAFRQEMERYEQQISQNIERGIGKPPTVHPKVIELEQMGPHLLYPEPPIPVRKWVLFEQKPITYTVVKVVQGEKVERFVEGVELVKKVKDPAQVDVAFTYDRAKGGTTVVFAGKDVTGPHGVQVVLRDKDEQEHLFPVQVLSEPPRILPLPILDVNVWFYKGHVCFSGRLQQPGAKRRPGEVGAPMEEFEEMGRGPGAPPLPGRGVAPGTLRKPAEEEHAPAVGWRIYRKPAGASDAEYRLVTTTRQSQMAVSKTEFGKWLAYNQDLAVAGEAAGVLREGPETLAPEGMPPAPGRPPVPVVEKPEYCRFGDTRMDYGEPYEYKVVAISPGPHVTESDPVIVPFDVPPDLELYVLKVDRETRKVRMQVLEHHFVPNREDPKAREHLVYEATLRDLVPGSPITGLANARVYRKTGPYWERRRSRRHTFDTGYFLVDAQPEATKPVPALDWDVRWEERVVNRGGRWVKVRVRIVNLKYQATPEPMPLVLYLDKKGRLRAEYRSVRLSLPLKPERPGMGPEPGERIRGRREEPEEAPPPYMPGGRPRRRS